MQLLLNPTEQDTVMGTNLEKNDFFIVYHLSMLKISPDIGLSCPITILSNMKLSKNKFDDIQKTLVIQKDKEQKLDKS